MRKKLLLIPLALLLAVSLIAIGCPTPPETTTTPTEPTTPTPPEEEMEPVVLKMASCFPPPETSMASDYARLWEDKVTEATDGKITFENYWGCALGTPAEHLTLVEKGTVDLVVSYGWYTPTKLPLTDFDYIFPFGPIDPKIITPACRQIYEEFPEFEKDLAKYNCTRVWQCPGTTFVFLSKESIKTLDDFEGLKCACIGRYFGRWIGAIGAVPVAAPGHERYTMLQTGVVDASFNPIDLAYCFKDIEQGPYCLDPELLITNWISFWINLDTLHSLPKDVQELILETGKEIEIIAAEEVQPEWTEKIWQEWQEGEGFHYSKLSDADRVKWAAACEDVPAEWAAEVSEMGYPGWEIVKRYQEITTELGFEWMREWGVKE